MFKRLWSRVRNTPEYKTRAPGLFVFLRFSSRSNDRRYAGALPFRYLEGVADRVSLAAGS